jgi:hypothetical protein
MSQRVYHPFEVAHLLRLGHHPEHWGCGERPSDGYAVFSLSAHPDLTAFRQAVDEVKVLKARAGASRHNGHADTR